MEKVTRDNWRRDAEERPEEWAGTCVFRESWSATSVAQVDMAVDPPGKLVFTDIPEYSVIDDLTGEELPASLVTVAKREEITEMYRRTVWKEKPIVDCFKDTGKPPIPVR